jgi:hypothetical protein
MLNIYAEISIQETVLEENDWIALKNRHEEILAPVLDPYLEKRSRQVKDPVLDFLFEYYPFRPSHLRRWSPGLGVKLITRGNEPLPEISELVVENGTAFINPAFFTAKRMKSVQWTLDLLTDSTANKPLFGCFGMHEWAMVYRAGEVRHGQVPLRLPDSEIEAFVESRPLVCTHFDAFRFFTESARPMNKHQLNRDIFRKMEQPGCIHTNMDLYKWAYKLFPWISGELIRETFLNAVEARKVDMQASPYDATQFGLKPIKIETEEGRKMYLDKQGEIYDRSMPLRKKLIDAYELVIRLIRQADN